MQVLISKAALLGVPKRLNWGKLSLGDDVKLVVGDNDQVTAYASLPYKAFGIFHKTRDIKIGHLGPTSQALLLSGLKKERMFRVRIIDIQLPHHGNEDIKPSVWISVWG
ncbi:hypothetical protein [Pseudogemmobacter sp. W21_MBD1_M6]|uniref:hypothetical protein n=1 Tax=Pseudogemmobacter sp. W21_MBD1_M6 TaxID=3240271 RepID=UPI003F9D6634